LLAGGSRYHAHSVPDDDLTADLYLAACECLAQGGVQQYEISNFARPVTHGIGLRDSKHNLKYWTRQPYLGFGVDAHSMLLAGDDLRAQGVEAMRFATPESLEGYQQLSVVSSQLSESKSSGNIALRLLQLQSSRTLIDRQAALEESFFLGLRLNRGVSLAALKAQFGDAAIASYDAVITELLQNGLLEQAADRLRLTARGRLLSNEVFVRFLRAENARDRTAELQP
jgi:oxygen-independent coproporphyrinogen-3 oxidase